jgi:hypothetical protein
VAGIFEILDIASEIVIWAFILVFGAVCLALALAFGLGGRDVAGRYLEKWLEPKKNEVRRTTELINTHSIRLCERWALNTRSIVHHSVTPFYS